MLGALSNSTVVLVLMLFCSLVGESYQRSVVNNQSSQNIDVSSEENKIKFGNSKTNNYEFLEKNYQPQQNTHVVFNVEKLKNPNKSRASRPPTIEEYAIKRRIMEIYETALGELRETEGKSSVYMRHLGRILAALNPKYIATWRVRDITFADPTDTQIKVTPPEAELPPPEGPQQTDNNCQQEPLLELRADGLASIQDQLDAVDNHFRKIVSWDKAFERELFQVPDDELSPRQLPYKRLIQCSAHPAFCKQKIVKKEKVRSDNEGGSDKSVDKLVKLTSDLVLKKFSPQGIPDLPKKPEQPLTARAHQPEYKRPFIAPDKAEPRERKQHFKGQDQSNPAPPKRAFIRPSRVPPTPQRKIPSGNGEMFAFNR